MGFTPFFLTLTILLTAVFLFLFLRRPQTRFEMFVLGAGMALLTPISDIQFLLPNFLFSFMFAGIAAVIFQQILDRHYTKRKIVSLPKGTRNTWLIRLFLIALAWSWFGIFLVFIAETSSWQAMIISALFVGSYIIAIRRDLFWDAILSGILMALLLFVLLEISALETQGTLSLTNALSSDSATILLGTKPTQVLIFAAVMGFALGPLYEFARDLRLKSK